jgi:transposase
MTPEEEVISLRQENQALRERVRVQQEQIDVQQSVIDQQQGVIEGVQQQTDRLSEQVQALQERWKKESHNSHLPPSSDRFQRQPKSLRKRSGKQPGGQSGHPGSTLLLSPTPEQVMVHPVEVCQHCQRDLCEVESLPVERRQVLDLPRQQCGGDRTPGPTEVLPQLSADQQRAVPRGRASAGAVWSGVGSSGRLSGRASVVAL